MGKSTQISALLGSYFRSLLARNRCIRSVLNHAKHPGATTLSHFETFGGFNLVYVLACAESNRESKFSCLTRKGI